MNLVQYITVNCGGPGSGCRGPNCGRKNEGRAQRARDSYIPLTKEKYGLAKANEFLVAKSVGGEAVSHNRPFDVLIGNKVGIEVKTIVEGKNDKLTVHPSSRAGKEKYAKTEGVKKTYTVGLDHRGCDYKDCSPTVYVKEGVGAFRLSSMTKIPNLQSLCKYIECQ